MIPQMTVVADLTTMALTVWGVTSLSVNGTQQRTGAWQPERFSGSVPSIPKKKTGKINVAYVL